MSEPTVKGKTVDKILDGIKNILCTELKVDETLSKQEQDIIRIYRASNGKRQISIMQFIYLCDENNKNTR